MLNYVPVKFCFSTNETTETISEICWPRFLDSDHQTKKPKGLPCLESHKTSPSPVLHTNSDT